jgi:hypothetical protein
MMKTVFLMLAAGIVFSLPSCNSGDAGTDGTPAIDTDTYTDTDTDTDYTYPSVYTRRLTLDCTVDDIKSFNATTGEIVFTHLILETLATPPYGPDWRFAWALTLYCDDKLLFEKIPITSDLSSYMADDLIFIYDPCIYGEDELEDLVDDPGVYRYKNREFLFEPRYYLVDGYPIFKEGEKVSRRERDGSLLSQDDIQRLRDKNFKKRKAEWDVFITYLRDSGKIVEE